MRAVNLVPAEERRGAGGAAGRSGGAAYILLGLLALLVIVVSVATLQKRSVNDKRAQVATLSAQAAAADARATALSSFTQFAGLRAQRELTVTTLAASRFDWSHAMGELARVIPSNVWLTGLQGTVSPSVTLKDSAVSGTSALRAAVPLPAVEMVGCTTDMRSVSQMLTRMRLIDGVVRVSLQSSIKTDAVAGAAVGGAAAASTATDCRQGSSHFPQFQLVVFLDQAAGAVPTTVPGAGGRVDAAVTTPEGATGATGPAAPIGATP